MGRARILNQGSSNNPKLENKVGKLTGITQSALQGLSFGSSDELQGLASGLYAKFAEGKDFNTAYDETVNAIRSDIKSFREEEPLYAYGSEIIGSLPTAIAGGFGLAKAGLSAIKSAGAMGGAYGGFATDSSDPVDKAIGTTIGGLTGGAFQKVAPFATEGAKNLIKKGVPLTVGQTVGGGLKKIEEALTSVPFMGSPISNAFKRSKQGFDKVVFEEVLEPLKKLGINPKEKLKDISGRDLYNTTEKIISDQYEILLPKLNMPNKAILQNRLDDIILNEVEVLPKNLQNQFLVKLDRIVYKNFVNGKISGEGYKDSISKIRTEIRNFKKSQEPLNQDMANSFRAVENEMVEILKDTNPTKKLSLDLIDQSFKRLLPVERAVISAEGGEFTADQLLRSIKSGDQSLRKKSYARGEADMQPLAEAGQNTIKQRLANSGTSDRNLLGTLALGGGLAIDPLTVGIGSGATTLGYSKLGVPTIRSLITGYNPNKYRPNNIGLAQGMAYGSPAYGGLLGQNAEDANFFGMNRR